MFRTHRIERPFLSASKRPLPAGWLRFGLALACFGLGLVVLYGNPALSAPLAPLDPLTARVTATLLEWSGIDVFHAGTTLSHPDGFSYQIYYRCTGLIVAAFLVVGVLALPGQLKAKLGGIALGVSLVLTVNFLRLVTLFHIGVKYPSAFDFVHGVLWEGGMLTLVLGFWLCWLRSQRRPSLQSGSASALPRKAPIHRRRLSPARGRLG